MSSELAIKARGLTKRYRIRASSDDSTARREWFTALDSIDLDVARGEVLGLIGRNGSGKSTLLKILSRITSPSEGVVDVWGRVGSLLEVGTGFHAELTGRENVYLNGAILGMRRREIEREFSNIVDFADIGPFLDTPVKRYSSGMRVRLAFAVAAHLNPEILLVDEVLAVGDAEFQSKCLGKMNDVATQEGRTVVFVSHNMAAVEHLCTRAVILDHGRIAFSGATEAAVGQYLAGGAQGGAHRGPGVFAIDGKHVVRVTTTDGTYATDHLMTGRELRVVVDLKDTTSIRKPNLEIGFWTANEQLVFRTTTRMTNFGWPGRHEDGAERIELRIPQLPLIPAHYWLSITLWDSMDGSEWDRVPRAAELQVATATNVFGTGYQFRGLDGLVYVPHSWSLGAADANAETVGDTLPA